MKYKCMIFDLDGVLVDTAIHHYAAWKELAKEIGINLTAEDNELLKGVSRMNCLDIILGLGKLTGQYTTKQKEEMANQKNDLYLSFIENMKDSDVLKGSVELLAALKKEGIKIALGSASKNAKLILEKVGILSYFDVIVDGHMVSKAKPDPEVFLLAAKLCGEKPKDCVVFDDAIAGIQAGKLAGMYTIGVGDAIKLIEADRVVSSLEKLNYSKIF